MNVDLHVKYHLFFSDINILNPNDIYIYIYMSYHSANLQKLHFNIYSTNIHTEYFKHAA